MENKRLPLEGVKVVEMATVVAAPTTARVLCAYGAEVIKVETLGGDVMRSAGTHEFTPYDDDCNVLFTVHNSNKKFVSLNYKTEEGMKVLLDLIKEADVFITNVREKSLVRNGLDYESLKKVNPGLIFGHFKGYGDKGPSANDPGFDISAFWLRAGALGDWQTEGAFPFLPTYAFGDMVTSSAFLAGIVMALYAKKVTGIGTKVDTSLFASGIWCNAIGLVQTQFDHKHMNPHPLRPTDPFNQTYKCKDGRWIGVYCNEYEMDREKWYGLFGIPEFAADPDYASIKIMQENGKIENVITICNGIFLTKTAQEWRDYLSENNCACEILKEQWEVSQDPQAIENEYIVPVEFPDEDHTTVMLPNPPIEFSDYGRREYKPTGVLGEDTDEILTSLGYTKEQIEEMRAAGAIK
ncbi:MAG: CaiB/BaiF CoA-transferase family protein [Firmicutes bacterium]|nr:CaiB/BaiF CoA-transferase family protein [Bacillota bacterium]